LGLNVIQLVSRVRCPLETLLVRWDTCHDLGEWSDFDHYSIVQNSGVILVAQLLHIFSAKDKNTGFTSMFYYESDRGHIGVRLHNISCSSILM